MSVDHIVRETSPDTPERSFDTGIISTLTRKSWKSERGQLAAPRREVAQQGPMPSTAISGP